MTETHAKAAPLQAVGNHSSHEPATPIEDENDDEDEYDLPMGLRHLALAEAAHSPTILRIVSSS